MKDFIHLSYFSICVKYQCYASWLGINATVTDFRRILCKVKIMLPFSTLATTPNPYEKNGDRTLKRMSKDETSIVQKTQVEVEIYYAADLHLNAVCKPLHALHFKKLENQVRSLLSSQFLFRMSPIPLRKCLVFFFPPVFIGNCCHFSQLILLL